MCMELTVQKSCWNMQNIIERVFERRIRGKLIAIDMQCGFRPVEDLRDPTVISVQFRRNLKTYLFAWHLNR